MDSPPIRYVKTSDGHSIAYCDVGKGTPFIWMPTIWSDQRWLWQSPLAPSLHVLAKEYRVITYDARGQGHSSRGLSQDHSLHDYHADLDALVEELQLDSVILSGIYFYGVVAMQYAAEHPDRVRGLIFRNPSLDYGASSHWLQLAEANWDMLLWHQSQAWFLNSDPQTMVPQMRDWYRQEDYVAVVRAVLAGTPWAVPRLRLPTLLVAFESAPQALINQGMAIAETIPGARLVVTGNLGWSGDPSHPLPPSLIEVLDFLHEVAIPYGQPEVSQPGASHLTPRETEVLRLIALGRTSREISAHLVLSERTVARHITNIYAKIGARGRAEATAYAIHQRLT